MTPVAPSTSSAAPAMRCSTGPMPARAPSITTAGTWTRSSRPTKVPAPCASTSPSPTSRTVNPAPPTRPGATQLSPRSYGQRLADKSQDTVAGTIDFFYLAPFDHAPWTQSYGTNYNCTGTPPVSTDLRCDDPQDDGTVKKPLVMSTFSLQSLTAYVGDDSTSSHKAFSYNFAYQDRAFPVCYDPYTLIDEYCAGEHLLTSITPSVYQNGTQHQLRP